MHELLTDLRSGVRMLINYPTLSLGAILTLGLGIGLSTTVFCVVNGGTLQGTPVSRFGPDRGGKAARGRCRTSANCRSAFTTSRFTQARQTAFEKFGAYGNAPLNVTAEDGRPERFSGGLLTVEAFEALGVQPELGRGFRVGDDRPGARARHAPG